MRRVIFRRACALLAHTALLVALLATTPATAASATACRVKNFDTGVTSNSLQKAVKAARPGHRLVVRGTCKGSTTIAKNLTIRGVRSATLGQPILDGAKRGTVMSVKPKAKVTLRHLTVRRGVAGTGGGIVNQGILVLGDVIVRANSAAYGGGVYNYGSLTLNGSSSIRANVTVTPGRADNSGSHTRVGSGSSPALTPDVSGGGVLNAGTLTMNGSSSIHGNRTDIWGGGVYNAGTLTLNGSSSISGNRAGDIGGGVYNVGDFSGVVCGGNVHHNLPDDCAP